MKQSRGTVCVLAACAMFVVVGLVRAQEPMGHPVPCPDPVRFDNGVSDTTRLRALREVLGTKLEPPDWVDVFAAMYPEPPDNERINMLRRIERAAEDAHETDIAERARARIEALTPVVVEPEPVEGEGQGELMSVQPVGSTGYPDLSSVDAWYESTNRGELGS